MAQTKFIAMAAHRKGISRMWMNVNNKGSTIEDSHVGKTGFMLYANPWSVYEGRYWDGRYSVTDITATAYNFALT
ncbi:hypothetical protein PFISCL1PPCAC_25265 [Pristionchus fissidentatus]|uniref:Uncharacterized protein n=1 Tax=Pristionchus fissidentatus TaxID=1538716 RepID=A0AAV5WTM0_9BILA|nr:hypothetical protein PFISCL1PPCAC_25265 [Pristionchus fissidentatus]